MSFDLAGIDVGNDEPLFLIAGPCVIESPDETISIAKALARMGKRLKLPILFKASFDKANRQSIESYRGPGLAKGLEVLAEVKEVTGLPILTDIHEPAQAEAVSRVADCLQIPAFLSRQTDLVVAAARTGRAVAIKKGQFLSPEQMPSLVEKAHKTGNDRVFVIERGTTFGYGDLVVDLRSLDRMKREGIPVVFDGTHSVQRPGMGEGALAVPSAAEKRAKGSGGTREEIPALLRGAVAVGIAGIFLETHPKPARAKSDSATQWPLAHLAELVGQALRVDKAVKR